MCFFLSVLFFFLRKELSLRDTLVEIYFTCGKLERTLCQLSLFGVDPAGPFWILLDPFLWLDGSHWVLLDQIESFILFVLFIYLCFVCFDCVLYLFICFYFFIYSFVCFIP